MSYWIPTKPYSFIDAINRRASATGSVGYAQATQSADYNGHRVTLAWNDYRAYYMVKHYFGQRVVHHRSASFAEALRAGVEEWRAQGRGAALFIHPREASTSLSVLRREVLPAEDEGDVRFEVARYPEVQPWSDDVEAAWLRSWPDAWKIAHVSDLLAWTKSFGPAFLPAFIEAQNPAELAGRLRALPHGDFLAERVEAA